MKIQLTQCSTALSPTSLPGLTYSLNPYRGCQHKCAYCYVPNVLRIPRDSWGTNVDVKHNIPTVLAKELQKKTPGVVGLSTVTDPYQPVEKIYQLSRYCLEQLLRYDFPVCIQTKSSLVLRDLDLIKKFTSIEIMVSIATLNDAERKILEPAASSIDERFRILTECANNGIKTSVFFGPLYPTITLQDLPKILDKFVKHNVSEILIDKLNIKPGIIQNIQKTVHNTPLSEHYSQTPSRTDIVYAQIRDECIRLGKERGITIKNAF